MKFGKDAIRAARLTLVNYINARLFHKDGHFANNNDWLYYMMNLYEEQQIQRNISFSFTRGFEQQSPDGSHVFTLNDPRMALDRMKGTPKYMQHCQNEFYAKLDNLGQFMIFFTLSCADRQWDENFYIILTGKKITYEHHYGEEKFFVDDMPLED